MIDWRAVGGVLGALLFALGLALLAPAAVGLGYREPSWWAFGVVAAGSFSAGALNEAFGWRGLNLFVFPFLAVAAAVILTAMARSRPRRADA